MFCWHLSSECFKCRAKTLPLPFLYVSWHEGLSKALSYTKLWRPVKDYARILSHSHFLKKSQFFLNPSSFCLCYLISKSVPCYSFKIESYQLFSLQICLLYRRHHFSNVWQKGLFFFYCGLCLRKPWNIAAKFCANNKMRSIIITILEITTLPRILVTIIIYAKYIPAPSG